MYPMQLIKEFFIRNPKRDFVHASFYVFRLEFSAFWCIKNIPSAINNLEIMIAVKLVVPSSMISSRYNKLSKQSSRLFNSFKQNVTECTGASAKENKAEALVIKLDFMSFRLRWKVSVDRILFFKKKVGRVTMKCTLNDKPYNDVVDVWRAKTYCSILVLLILICTRRI